MQFKEKVHNNRTIEYSLTLKIKVSRVIRRNLEERILVDVFMCN